MKQFVYAFLFGASSVLFCAPEDEHTLECEQSLHQEERTLIESIRIPVQWLRAENASLAAYCFTSGLAVGYGSAHSVMMGLLCDLGVGALVWHAGLKKNDEDLLSTLACGVVPHFAGYCVGKYFASLERSARSFFAPEDVVQNASDLCADAGT